MFSLRMKAHTNSNDILEAEGVVPDYEDGIRITGESSISPWSIRANTVERRKDLANSYLHDIFEDNAERSVIFAHPPPTTLRCIGVEIIADLLGGRCQQQHDMKLALPDIADTEKPAWCTAERSGVPFAVLKVGVAK